MLFDVVVKIVAVFTDTQHTGDGKFVLPQRHSFINGFRNSKTVLFCQTATEIVGVNLVGIQRHQFQLRACATGLPPTFQNLADEYVSM